MVFFLLLISPYKNPFSKTFLDVTVLFVSFAAHVRRRLVTNADKNI